eukprot:COSAG01_NODE_7934_length_2985_cov_8.088011_4_plen_180_part_00
MSPLDCLLLDRPVTRHASSLRKPTERAPPRICPVTIALWIAVCSLSLYIWRVMSLCTSCSANGASKKSPAPTSLGTRTRYVPRSTVPKCVSSGAEPVYASEIVRLVGIGTASTRGRAQKPKFATHQEHVRTVHNPSLRPCSTAPEHPHVVCTPYSSITGTRLWCTMPTYNIGTTTGGCK